MNYELNIAIVSTSGQGGAGKAAFRLYQGLSQANCRVMLVAQHQIEGNSSSVLASHSSTSRFVRPLIPHIDRLPLHLYRGRTQKIFSCAWAPAERGCKIASENADVVNLHWINGGFCSVEAIGRIKKPIVWTLHDAWPFSGGCHYPADCMRFETRCGTCPQLGSRRPADLSRFNIIRKIKAWRNLPLTIVTPSRWLGNLAAKSSVFRGKRIEVIPNGINLSQFRPLDPSWAKSILGLDDRKKWLLFGAWGGATDPRKGFDLLQQALLSLATDLMWKNKIGIITFGNQHSNNESALPFPVKALGELHDDISLILAYNAADVFIAPSREDNLPNTVLEALACGVPSVAFRVGGIPDLIEHEVTGWLANPYHADELAEGIKWVLLSQDSGRALKSKAREKAENEFSLELHASRYLSLFNGVLQ